MTPERIDTWRANARIYLRLIGLLRPHWQRAVGAVLCVFLATGFALAIPWLLAWVVDVGLRRGHGNDLVLAALVILAASLLRGLFAYGQSYLAQAVSQL